MVRFCVILCGGQAPIHLGVFFKGRAGEVGLGVASSLFGTHKELSSVRFYSLGPPAGLKALITLIYPHAPHILKPWE